MPARSPACLPASLLLWTSNYFLFETFFLPRRSFFFLGSVLGELLAVGIDSSRVWLTAAGSYWSRFRFRLILNSEIAAATQAQAEAPMPTHTPTLPWKRAELARKTN